MVKSHLSLAIMLGLGITSVSAGELKFSPSIESSLSASSEKSGDPIETKRTNDALLINELNFDVDYTSNILTSKINVNAFDKRYEENKENDDGFVTYSLNNTLSVLDDNWVSDAYYEFDYKILNDSKSSFNDLIYQTGSMSDVESYGVSTSYSLPSLRSSSIQASIDASFRGSATSAGPEDIKNKQSQTDLSFTLSQGESSRSLQWRFLGYLGEKDSEIGTSNSNRTSDLLFRIPMLPSLMAVGSANYTYQKSKNASFTGEFDDNVEYANYGGGFAYYNSKKGDLFQVTASLDSRSDDYYIGTEFRWIFQDEHYLKGKVSRKFYGDSGDLTYFYSSGRNVFEVYYEEEVELRYMLDQEVINEGLYVCSDDVDFFDDALCWKPEQLNYELQPGETIIPKILINYPLSDRLVLNKDLGFNWSYKNDFLHSKFQAYKSKMEEIDEDYEQESDNVSLMLSHRLNSLSSIEYEFKYRKMTFLPISNKTYDTLYKVRYNHELNTRSQWSFGIQYVSKKSDYEIDNFNEVRFTLSYEHHFGKNNIRSKSMF